MPPLCTASGTSVASFFSEADRIQSRAGASLAWAGVIGPLAACSFAFFWWRFFNKSLHYKCFIFCAKIAFQVGELAWLLSVLVPAFSFALGGAACLDVAVLLSLPFSRQLAPDIRQ